ncbi:hypothetical protein ACFFF5_18090 [Lederbergia wuyishanensis]|uniref:Lysylphosphatidylglycerol synthetase-like protein (DUF2156 family) n=1 Tax=Lederbergia wuyishanensis TaxID=1347903 RepID=A0ABU0D4L6_9BACI|nr:hypothetical protein [Lederbergia wuyishanensis]MCJ8008062.1 hypothetical protein [Lederbergia wuyishanensis]MDQ0343353.1 lysylphosphatidylglycerol synthetase-like protein (DUF2156 family) [Lederbergia wuyishanensis]
MKFYKITKIVGIVAGILTMFVAIGFGILFLIGTGLYKALNSGYENATPDISVAITIVIILLLLGLITGLGPFWLKKKTWRIIYIGLCLVLGLGFIIAFIISIRALGWKNEIFILGLGAIFFLQSYLVIKKR